MYHLLRTLLPALAEIAPALIGQPDYVLSQALAILQARWSLRGATQIGAYVRVWGSPILSNRGVLRIGRRARLVSTVTPLELVIGRGGVLEIGERVFVNYGTSIAAMERVSIGPSCNIGSHVTLLDNNLHHICPERRLEQPPSQPVILEENVWVGSRAIVLPGVRIGAHSVIGAGSVVTRNVPPRTLVAGVPARVVRSI